MQETNEPVLLQGPFTETQQRNIIEFQASSFHSYTCPKHPDRDLYVGTDYLACNDSSCGYIQYDVLNSVANGEMNKYINEVLNIVEQFKNGAENI